MTFRCKCHLGHCSGTVCDYPLVQCLKSPLVLVGPSGNPIRFGMPIPSDIQKWGNLFLFALDETCFDLDRLISDGSSAYLGQGQTKDM